MQCVDIVRSSNLIVAMEMQLKLILTPQMCRAVYSVPVGAIRPNLAAYIVPMAG